MSDGREEGGEGDKEGGGGHKGQVVISVDDAPSSPLFPRHVILVLVLLDMTAVGIVVPLIPYIADELVCERERERR